MTLLQQAVTQQIELLFSHGADVKQVFNDDYLTEVGLDAVYEVVRGETSCGWWDNKCCLVSCGNQIGRAHV